MPALLLRYDAGMAPGKGWRQTFRISLLNQKGFVHSIQPGSGVPLNSLPLDTLLNSFENFRMLTFCQNFVIRAGSRGVSP